MLNMLLVGKGLLKCKSHIYVCIVICIRLLLEWVAVKSQDVVLAHGSICVGLFLQRRKTVQQTNEDL